MQRIADIDWERNERPYIPDMDDNPQGQAHVIVPEGFDHAHAKISRVPFWAVEHPQKENTYAVLLGHPGMEHAQIHDMHDPGFQEWPLAYSGGIWPGGSGKMGPGGDRTFDKDTIEFYNSFLRDPLGPVHEYEDPAFFHDQEYYREHPDEVTPEHLDMERRVKEHTQKQDMVQNAVESGIMRHMQGNPYNFAKGDSLAPNEYDFERYSSEFDTEDFQNKLDSELRDPKQLVPWAPGTEAKAILHHNGDVTSWQNPYIHHQEVERFLGKPSQMYIDHIDPKGTALVANEDPRVFEQLRAKGFDPRPLDSYNWDFGAPEDDYVGLNG